MSALSRSPLPTFDDVGTAARTLSAIAHRTAVVTSTRIDQRAGCRVFFKCENLQRAGAFKFRGAYNALSHLTPDERRRGVVTYSSGNHAQALALAGQLLDIPRVIVMPSDAPEVKRRATQSYGAEIVMYDPGGERREDIGRRIARERGLTLIPPFDHPHIIAGAGTAAVELFDEVGALDCLLVPCGGGGLLSGSALAASGLAPGCRVIGVEPSGGDDATRSFHTGRLHTIQAPQTVADGARTSSLGSLTFPLVRALVADMVTVDDAGLLRTMFYLWERLKLVIEPTGALGATALLDGTYSSTWAGAARIGVILSGGNVDFSQVARWLEAAKVES